ncbi:DHHC-type zinc finger family protein [Perilla frutescens var. hirtella]|uniref:S-acyltransferase n=1 Tax=Perilla frutescens var. hirtella TaxID=608512 RepID=A0AAD4P7D8_PERFH|nr:DHHC-type zinc finger family protein [Perilla frutescens var. frutescens]KAH6794519.1 DHHC-type zinc finger family protein [Perilla frutescens var. hirtella]KAH6828655.1 DHHC-type zinc finger family protein [Perilla frutescens var. hirtella]
MGGMKNQDFVAAPPKWVDSPAVKKRRLYQVWKGRNNFFCGGRLIIGPDSRSVVLTTLMIGGPALAFCTKMFLRISTVDCFYEHAVLIMGLVLTFLDLTFLFMTSTRNPGIIPRNTMPVLENTSLDSFPSIEWIANATPGLTLPRTKDVIVNGHTVKVKYCDTCLLYRPPRASHCSTCNNCIQRFDHHCPWLNQCIGVRNYGTFILFISTSTILCLYVFTFSLLNVLKETGQTWTWRVMTGDVVLVFLMVYCFITVWFVGGLSLFHYYLIITNQTTYENFRCLYGHKENPYNRGVMKNVKEILFSGMVPSLVNFREWVTEEVETFPESINKRFGWDITKSNKKVDLLELGININGFEDSVKDRGSKTTTYDPFLLPIDQDETLSVQDPTAYDDEKIR